MIEGAHTGLRAIERDDLPRLLEWRNRPHFRRHFREYRELSLEQQLAWYDDVVLGDRNTCMFAIVERGADGGGECIGAGGLCDIDHRNRSADLSIYLGKDDFYIDDRLAPDAARLLLGYGFGELNLHRIWTEIYSTDDAKQLLFEGLGFTLDGRHRETRWLGEAWVDSLFYSLLESEAGNAARN